MKELTKVTVLILIKVKNLECMICHYWYFSDGFKYQPYICNGCHDFNMVVQNLSDFFILTVHNIDYRVDITNVDKKLQFIC